jgi:hypothetical protein
MERMPLPIGIRFDRGEGGVLERSFARRLESVCSPG